MKRGFTMIELIFVVVILGILAAVAIPKLAASRDDAKAAAIKTDIGTILQAVPAWYTGQQEISVENAMQFDSNVWKNVNSANAEYVYTDPKQGTAKIVVFGYDSTETNMTKIESDFVGGSVSIGSLESDKSITVGNDESAYMGIILEPASTNNSIVYVLQNDLGVNNVSVVSLAGRKVNWK